MNAGSLRHIVTIQAPTVSKSGGVQETEWADFATGVHASIDQLKPYEKSAIAASFPAAEYKITMRYRPGIVGNMRIIGPDGLVYVVVGQPNDIEGRHRELQLLCECGVKD